MAGLWVSGGFLFRLLEEEREPSEPEGGWPVTILVPAYNEESVIPANVQAARAGAAARPKPKIGTFIARQL